MKSENYTGKEKSQYNRLVIFDLDGVLIDSRELHWEALNRALTEVAGQMYVISKEEHLAFYDGLPTREKLEMLSQRKGLARSLHSHIARNKQEHTMQMVEKFRKSPKLIAIFDWLVNDMGYKIGIASNAVRSTVLTSMCALGLDEYVSVVMTNEDVKRTKPYPEMYWRCMESVGAIPRNTLIVEDSHIGREGALSSGANLLAVSDPEDLTIQKVRASIAIMENDSSIKVPWISTKLNVVIPMAGAGSRFSAAGYTFPKPLIEVNGKPMIQVVAENLNIDANFIYIVQEEHYHKYNLKYLLNLITPGCKIVQINGVTDGAARTVLAASYYLDNDNPVLIVNSDQYMEWNSNECLYAFSADQIDGGILTFKNTHPKWSYVKLDDNGFVTQVAEKKPISDIATVGVYYWSKGSDFVKYANQMIDADDRVNGEFYVAPVYNYAIADGKKFRIKNIEKFWGLGTPEDLNTFLREKS